MKYVIILPDGAADEPVTALEGRTPLEAAKKPNIDWIAEHGRQGRVVTVPDGFSPGSDVATLSLFGYDPRTDYSGRAPLEAAARGIPVGSDDLIYRCNFVTISNGAMTDFTAGHIRQVEADRLIHDLNAAFESGPCCFFSGVSYRNLMVLFAGDSENATCTPPHDIPDQPVARHVPRGAGSERLKEIADRAHDLLERHEVNIVRRDLGEDPATDIWLWGQGRPKALMSFQERFHLSGAVIAAVDLIRGMAKSVGLEVIDVPGATGFLDTDYAGKGAAAIQALKTFDLVVVHIEAPDEAGHLGDALAKVQAIERIDEHIVGPLLAELRRHQGWRIMIAPDHPTPVERRVHTAVPPPFCFAGHDVDAGVRRPFSEVDAAESGLYITEGHELIGYFLRTVR